MCLASAWLRAEWRTILVTPEPVDSATSMIELLRTNDLILISFVQALLMDEDIACFVADQHMSAVEGSLGFLPRRIMVDSDMVGRARLLLAEAGLAEELGRE